MSSATAISPKQARRYHRRFSRLQQTYERYAAKIFLLALEDQIRQFIRAAVDYPAGMEAQAVNEISPMSMAKAFRRVALSAASGMARMTDDEMQAEETGSKSMASYPDFDGYTIAWDHDIGLYDTKEEGEPGIRELTDAYLRHYGAGKVRDVTETTRKWIAGKIVEGQQNNLRFEQVAKSLMSDGINAMRALRIARTETVKYMNLGRYLAAEKSMFEKEKVWVDAHDDRVRPKPGTDGKFDHHASSIKVTKNLRTAFIVSREYLMFPGDTSLGASAGNVINCRCSFALRSKRDQHGRLMVRPPRMSVDASGSLEVGGVSLNENTMPEQVFDLISRLFVIVQLGRMVGQTFLSLFQNENQNG